jgi:hypothetical protein
MTADHGKFEEITSVDQINLKQLEGIIANDRLTWYTHPVFVDLVDTYFVGDSGDDLSRDIRRTVTKFMAQMIEDRLIIFGDQPPQFNDDNRSHKDIKQMFPYPPGKEDDRKDAPNIITIHHTSMNSKDFSPDDPYALSLQEVHALQMMRLYVPRHRDTLSFMPNGICQPLDSGHRSNKKLFPEQHLDQPVFFGYHYIILPDGTAIRTLRDIDTGFNSGSYWTNCNCTALAVFMDLTKRIPTPEAINTMATVARLYNPEYVLGHSEVVTYNKQLDKFVPTAHNCPGAPYFGENGWKQTLLRLIGNPNIKTIHPFLEEK